MRLFIALNFSDTEKDLLCSLQQQLKEKSTAGNFTRRENLHMTLAFLGDIPPDGIPKLREILTSCAKKTSPFSLSLDRLDFFPGKGQEKLWYLSGKTPSDLGGMVQALYIRLTNAGFRLEQREFLPHVTLGRRCITQEPPEIIPITAAFFSVELMLSQQIHGVLTYTPIYSVHLRRNH